MAAKILCRTLELEPLPGFGLTERPYPARVLICFWWDSNNKTLIFLRFRILVDISVLFILAIIKIW